MRCLKFRAWDKRDREMSNVFSLDDLYQAGLMGLRLEHKEDDYIIMQFTGLLDKEGKEIYEGDILEAPEDWRFLYDPDWLGSPCRKGIVSWNETDARYWLESEHLIDGAMDDFLYMTRDISMNDIEIDVTEMIVIGNIYEHKHLTKV